MITREQVRAARDEVIADMERDMDGEEATLIAAEAVSPRVVNGQMSLEDVMGVFLMGLLVGIRTGLNEREVSVS